MEGISPANKSISMTWKQQRLMMCCENWFCIRLESEKQFDDIRNKEHIAEYAFRGNDFRYGKMDRMIFIIPVYIVLLVFYYPEFNQKGWKVLTKAPFISLNTTPLKITSEDGSFKSLCSKRQPSCLEKNHIIQSLAKVPK